MTLLIRQSAEVKEIVNFETEAKTYSLKPKAPAKYMCPQDGYVLVRNR